MEILCDFKNKDKKAKAKFLLQLIKDDSNKVANIVEGSYDMNIDDFIITTDKNFPEILMDPSITVDDVKNLEKFWKSDGKKISKYLKTLMKTKRRDNVFTCPTCSKRAADGTAQCDSCLAWYHLKRCVPLHKMAFPKRTNQSWYCDKCVAILKNKI